MDAPLGLESGTVRVAPYDDRWPKLFRVEAVRIAAALSPLTVQLEHTGSTAVPGLAAKPVLDILAGYEDATLLDSLVAGFQAAGYDHRGPQGIPERQFFRRGQPRSYHVHLTAIDSQFWRDHLAFRDCLRADPVLRAAYGALKVELAGRHPSDREAYIEGKSAFVRAALDRADGR